MSDVTQKQDGEIEPAARETEEPASPAASMLGSVTAGLGRGMLQRKLQNRIQRRGRGGVDGDPQAAFDQATSGVGGQVPYRQEMERAFGQDFSNVESHPGKGAPMESLGAQAATQGEKVAFAEASPSKDVVAHELTHIVQSRQSGGGGVAAKSEVSDPDSAAEVEADQVGARAAAGERVTVSATPDGSVHRDPTPAGTTGGTTTAPAPATGAPAEAAGKAKTPEEQIADAIKAGDGDALNTTAGTPDLRKKAVAAAVAAKNPKAVLAAAGKAKGGGWETAVASADYDALLAASPTPIADKVQYEGVWFLFGDGSGRSAAAGRATFSHLYSSKLLAPGDTTAFWPLGSTATDDWRDVYMPVEPDENAIKKLLRNIRNIPQGQVGSGNIAFVHAKQTQKKPKTPPPGGAASWTNYIPAPNPSGNLGTVNITTSYFLGPSNSTALQCDAAGSIAGNENVIGKTADGNGLAVGGAAAAGSPALTFFMNHARHEIGHSVGNRKFDGMAESGDDWAKAYGGWKTEDKAAFKTAYFKKSGKSKGDFSAAGGKKDEELSDADVGSWMTEILATGAQPPANGISNLIATPASKFAAIKAVYGTENLTGYFDSITGGGATLKVGGYTFPGFIPSGDEVHMYNGGFHAYSKTAFDNLLKTHGWYCLSTYQEMFAEIYTNKYSAGTLPGPSNGKDPADFFQKLEASKDSSINPTGVTANKGPGGGPAAGPGGGPAAGPGGGADAGAGATASGRVETPPASTPPPLGV